ncbi:MAG: GHKL domain-containing protein [Acidaminobacter sp.]|uniref:sensor histidine kinase n=1 Tax=Acidaminobacter sp. TaxID=1872102 RepID=UPI001382E5E1|nr:ATP-binding protein [Acidaminobacter sp.]MZQ99717.1 GHKL domain-containing protein [Acidaminobacter sp.]
MLKNIKLERNKLILSWMIGLFSLAGIFFSTRLAFNEFSINFPWSLILPMVVTLAWGRFYGMVCLVLGGVIIYPFILGPYNGWASLVPVISYGLWIQIQGWGKGHREGSKALRYNAYFLQVIYSLARMGLYIALFPILLKLNGVYLYPNALNSMSTDVIVIFAVKGIIVEFVFLALADALLQLPFIRRMMLMEVRVGSERNTLIMSLMFFGGLFFAWLLLFVQQVIVRGESTSAWFLGRHDETQITLILSGLLFSIAGGITVRFVEKTLASKVELQQKQQALTKANNEILQLNEVLEKRVEERTAKLEEAVADLESFTFTVSHDLKSPLRALQVYGSMLEEDNLKELPGTSLEMLREMQALVADMISLIEHLLKFSVMSKTPLEDEIIDLNDLVEECIKTLSQSGSDQRVRVVLPDPLPVITGDRVMMRQIFMNLLDNAIKFSSLQSAPQIIISSIATDVCLEICIQDNGVGFDSASKAQLFQIFGRGHRKEDFAGYGVGLATVKKLIEKHGGTVSLEGKAGEGASACISLPLERRVQ